jgi:hypothetical protein
MQQSYVGFFHNERTQSTLLDSKFCFGAFQTVSLLHKLGAKLAELERLVH